MIIPYKKRKAPKTSSSASLSSLHNYNNNMPPKKLPRNVKTFAVSLSKQTQSNNDDQNTVPIIKGIKRKVETSNPPLQDIVKRLPLGNISNGVVNVPKEPLKDISNIRRDITNVVVTPPQKKRSIASQQHHTTGTLTVPTNKKLVNGLIGNANLQMAPRTTKIMTRAEARATQSKLAKINETVTTKLKVIHKPKRRFSTQLRESLDRR